MPDAGSEEWGSSMAEAYIVDAVRTPVGRRNGALRGVHPGDLGAHVLRALMARNDFDPASVDDVVFGCCDTIGPQAGDIARTAWLAAGLPEHVPGTTIDRQCGSSQQAAHFAAQGVIAGAYDVVVAAGVEVMTRVPMGSSMADGKFTNFGPGFAFTPGKGYGYSGEGYEYLRHWLRARTGKALDVEAQAQVFTPAGMTETAFTAQRWFKGRLAHPAVDGGFIPPTLPDEPSAADNVHTTARDYARFLVWLMGSGGLTPDLAAEQRTIQASQGDELCNKAMPAHCPESAGFGLGWQVIHLGAKTFLMHTGNDAGEFSFAYWSPDTREGAVILTNGNRGAEAVLAAIDQEFLDLHVGLDGKVLLEDRLRRVPLGVNVEDQRGRLGHVVFEAAGDSEAHGWGKGGAGSSETPKRPETTFRKHHAK